jgi:hypothetical protein
MSQHLFQKTYWYVGLFMSILIFFMGIGLLFTNYLSDNLPTPNRTYLGGIFLVYSVFRGTRVYQQSKKFKNDEE